MSGASTAKKRTGSRRARGSLRHAEGRADRSRQSSTDEILDLVVERVRLCARRRVAWLQRLWSQEGEPGGRYAITHPEMVTHLDDLDAPRSEAEWMDMDGSVRAVNSRLERVEEAIASDRSSRFAKLHEIFAIKPGDSDILQACLALALDPSLSRVYAYIQDHAGRAYVTDALVGRLFGHGRTSYFRRNSLLARWRIVLERDAGPAEPPMLYLDRQIRDWLRGCDTLDDHLFGRATPQVPSVLPEEWPLDVWLGRVKELVEASQDAVRVSVVGPGGTGRGALAAEISRHLGYSLLVVHVDRVDPTEFADLYVRAQRQAYLDGCAIAWFGDHARARAWPSVVKHFPVQFVIRESDGPMPPEPGVMDVMVEVPPTSLDARRQLWHALLPASKRWSRRDMEEVVGRNQVGVGDIARVARMRVKKPDEAMRVLRDVSRHRLGELAQPVECPFTLDDLVVPKRLKRALDDLIYEARERSRFWERPEARRLFPMGRGLIALFSGPPGTGKTMSAQVVAASLGMDLYRIDLSTVISRYVGQTSENIQRVLSTATQMMGVVLMFDECDALFSKRVGDVVDAQDRYVNSDSAHLLQAIETYPGIALLCTNKKANIDQAFVRRLRYAIEFPRPDADDRYRIWQRVVSELAGKPHARAIDSGLRAVAKEIELTGGQIKFAVLTALFSAQRNGGKPNARHFLDGIDRELMKEGRMLSSDERGRVTTH